MANHTIDCEGCGVDLRSYEPHAKDCPWLYGNQNKAAPMSAREEIAAMDAEKERTREHVRKQRENNVAVLLRHFHQNACYPVATEFEVATAAREIMELFDE